MKTSNLIVGIPMVIVSAAVCFGVAYYTPNNIQGFAITGVCAWCIGRSAIDVFYSLRDYFSGLLGEEEGGDV